MNARHAATLAFVLLFSGVTSAEQPNAETARLIVLDKQWMDAYTRKDKSALKDIESENFVAIEEDGSVLSREQDLAGLSGFSLDSVQLSEMTARIFGTTGIVTGRMKLHFANQAKSGTTELRFTDVFVKRDGKWHGVSSQLTTIAKQ